MLGRLGGGGLASRIGSWGSAIKESVSSVLTTLRREGIAGGISEIVRGREEVFAGITRQGPLDALPNTKRAGANLYTPTDLQLSRAMKADFDVTYIPPGGIESKTFRRSMLFDADRSKGALIREFESRLKRDIQTAAPTSAVAGINVIGVDLITLNIRSDVDYTWEPDDTPW